MGTILTLAILTFLLWIGYTITGVLLQACIWVFIKIPIACVLAVVAVVCCCTLILIPVGVSLLKTALKLLIPGI